ncbi:MAG: GTP-binding protein, partial [Candidatus Thorarchaeota archaeon]|nr:GTP-binding protein [Candidatus Thorarchaeota archaeon]
MIHNTFLIRISSKEILATTKYWPVDIQQNAIDEFVSTRENLRSEHDTVEELALIVGDYKFHAKDLVADTLLVFVTDKNEDETSIFEKVDDARKKLKRVLAKSGLKKVIENYARLIEPSVTIRLKIALVGEGGVGKTTTLHLLLGDTPPLQYVPTIALNLETVENIRFGNYSLVLWDFAGQERFRKLWRFYFHGADVIFLVCDSSLRNVIISKDILKLIKRDAPKVPVFAMANKQDKPNAMKPEVVQKILGIPTYPMVAIDKARRDEMLRILMTAASQYVGVALPDLPASELLKFTDTATEEAIAETDAIEALAEEAALEDDEEYETVIEEVLVDEDGHIIEDAEDYEIIEEVVEEIFEDEEEEEEAEEVVEEVKVEEEEEVEIEVTEPEEIETVVSPEVEVSEIHAVHEEVEQIELAAMDELTDSTEVSEEIEEPTEFEITPEAADEIVADSSGEVSIEVEVDEPVSIVSDSDEVFATSEESPGPEVVIVP